MMAKRRSQEEVARSNAATARHRFDQTVTEARLAAFQRAQKAGDGGGARMAHGSYPTQRDRTRNPRAPMGGSANWHLDPTSLRDMRRDSQAALRNDRVARGMFKRLRLLTLGDGVGIIPQTSDTEFNEKKQRLFEAWAGNDYEEARRLGYTGTREGWTCEGSGLSTLLTVLEDAMKAAITDGDIGIGMTATDDRGGGGKVAMFEAERMMGPKGPYAQDDFRPGQGGWIGGVELDAAGMALRAGIAPWGLTQGQPANAGAEGFEYLNLRDGSGMLFRNPMDHSANQVRGEPALAAVLPGLDQLDEYDKSVREAARNQAAVVGAIISTSPGMFSGGLVGTTDDASPASGTGTSSGASTAVNREIRAGTWFDAGPGSDVRYAAPTQPGAEYRGFKAQQTNEIGSDIGSAPIVANMDGVQSNYSGFRAALALNFQIAERWREELRRVLRFIEVFKTAQWMRAGLLAMPADWSIPSHYVWAPMPMLDPAKEVSTANAAVAGGLRSRDETTLALYGRTALSVDEERKVERKREIDYGLDKPNMIGQGPPVPAEPEEPDEAGSGKAEGGGSDRDRIGGVGGRFGAHANGTTNGAVH